MPEENEMRKILIEIEYEPNHVTPASVRLNLQNTSITDMILAWSALTERVITAANNSKKGQSLTQFLGNTIRAYAVQNGADHYDDDEDSDKEMATQE